MSGQCYPVKSLVSGMSKPEKDINCSTEGKLKASASTEHELLEYATLVSSAESKCTELRGHLERIKKFYNKQSTVTKSTTKVQKFKSTSKDSYAAPVVIQMSNSKLKPVKLTRQNSQRISTDRSGAAHGTISNILAGIAKSMPISDFTTAKPLETHLPNMYPPKYSEEHIIRGVEQVKIYSKSKTAIPVKSKTTIKVKKTKSKVSSSSGNKTLKAPAKTSKRRTKFNEPSKIVDNVIPPLSKQNPPIKRKSKLTIGQGARLSPAHQDLVELYHNTAVKESRSSDSDVPKKNPPENRPDRVAKSELIPPLNIDDDKPERIMNKGIVGYIGKNYENHTISSRMKRVAKNYMNAFSIKAIPFCTATSTGPSHNIGINIQQVMNMVKIKQPVGHLSPTLAYNIALVASQWSTNPLSMVVSHITSRTAASLCPLSKQTINYQQMQDMAKNVPEAVIEEVDENEDVISDSPETQSVIITGPSGDVKVTNRKETVWTANPEEKKCTCVPRRGLEIQQIINKFNGTVSRNKLSKPSLTSAAKIRESRIIREEMIPCVNPVPECTPLQNKERNLKEVLAKLHDEFEKMTIKYDELVKQSDERGDTPELGKQLEHLDKELNSKEEEIVMVMSLYKEVLALKEQVKTLKERSSRDIVAARAYPSQCKSNGFNDGATAKLLSKLLRRIQHFQTYYKKI